MAKTHKLTLDKNSFLVYQTINDLDQCEEERLIRAADFKDAIPVKNPESSKYYYMNLSWESERNGDYNYLGFDGYDFELPPLNYTVDKGSIPSVIPKYTVNKRSYIADSKGCTLLHFVMDEDTSNLRIKEGNNYNKFRYNFSLYDNWAYSWEHRDQYDYDDDYVKKDADQFNSTWDFDSDKYARDSEFKIVNEVHYDDENQRIYHSLHYYYDGEEPSLYYKDEITDEEYVQLKDDVSLVTFIPHKKPESNNNRGSYELEWELCVFCRGEAASDNWSEVSPQDGKNPKRIKMEWRPLHLTGSNKSIKLTNDEFHDFFERYDFDYPSDDFVPTDDIIPASYSNIKTVEVEAYNIDYNRDEDDFGILYDNRNVSDDKEYTEELVVNGVNPTYYIQQENYYRWDDLNGVTILPTTSSFILMDYEGYCLYCPELLFNYGIGFIKSDWVYLDENNHLYVKVTQAELDYYYGLWYKDDGTNLYPKGDIEKGRIYSTKYLELDKNENRLIPSNGYTNTADKCSENLVYNYFDSYYNDYSNIENKTGLNGSEWKYIADFRTGSVPYPLLYSYGESNNTFEHTLLQTRINKVEDNGTTYCEIVVYQRANINNQVKEENKIYSHFVRYRLKERTDFGKGPYYQSVAFWRNINDQPVLHTIYGIQSDRTGDWWKWKHDYANFIPVFDDNNQYIIKQVKYFITYTLTFDIEPKEINKCVPTTWSSCLNWKKGIFQKNKIKVIDITRNTNITQDEELQHELESRIYMTPSEWYSENLQVIDDEPEAQDWFWLDTLGNWCKYQIGTYDHTTADLYVWNGLGDWDRLYDIMFYYQIGDNYQLIKKYLYSNEFFKQGPMYSYAFDRICYVPIKNALGADGQMRYASLILTKDSKSILYKTKMNMDYANVYHNADYNSYARANYGEASQTQKERRDVERDPNRKYAIGSETQPVPCLIRGANGNLSIMYTFVVQTNGPVHGNFRNIVNTINEDGTEDVSELNRKCKTIFGDGSDKTIEKDWKRYIVKETSEEFKSEIKNISEETLYNSASLNTIKAGSIMTPISINAMRPNPSTNNKNISDYLERWNK